MLGKAKPVSNSFSSTAQLGTERPVDTWEHQGAGKRKDGRMWMDKQEGGRVDEWKDGRIYQRMDVWEDGGETARWMGR